MAWNDLDDDEKFILYVSVGIVGAFLLGAFILAVCDPLIFANRYDDGEEDEEFQYLGDQMMQPSTKDLQQRQSASIEATPEQPLPVPSPAIEAQQQQQKPGSTKALQGQANEEIQEGANIAQARLQPEAQEEINLAQPRSSVKISLNSVEVIPDPSQIKASNDDEEDSFESNEEDTKRMREYKRRRHRLSVKGTVVPRMERLPLHRFLFLSILVALPTMIYMMYFTALGWGETTFYWMTEHYGEYASAVGGATTLFFSALYLLDANFWTARWLKILCLTILVCATVFTVLVLTGDYPYGPICCFAAITPLWLISVNQLLCCRGKVRTRDYVSSLSGPLFFVSVVFLIAFLVWTFSSDHHQYNRVTKVAFSQATGCEPSLEEYPNCSYGFTNPPTPSPTINNTAAPIVTATENMPTVTSNVTETDSNTTAAIPSLSNPPLTDAPTEDEMNDDILLNGTSRFLHEVPDVAEHDEHDKSYEEDEEDDREKVEKLNNENDDNVYLGEETGVCFDTVVSPPAFYLHEGCDEDCPDDLYNNCLNAFILWAGPLLCSMVLFFLSFFCTFLKGEDAEKDIINFGKLWLFLLFSMWLTASLAGVAAGLSSALVAMTLASFVGSIVFVATTRTTEESKKQGKKIWGRIEENYGAYLDVVRGLFLVTCTPFIFLYLIFSVLNQAVRKLGLPCSKPLKTPQQRADFVTKRTRNQINAFQSWDRAKVLTYAVYWGIAFMILQVIVAQFTVLFLSWLIEATSNLNLGLVTAILVLVGMIMFLLPPVPGVPIYLTLGIVILAVGQDLLGLVGSMAYAAAVSLALKLIACTIQQKLIGENLARSISVRKLVLINSNFTKAMRLVLAEPGMGVAKVSILVGGPDWPTSVLCGIMGLDLLPVLFGTLPVILLILPTMLSGSFLYMAGLKCEEGESGCIEGELLYPSASVLATVFAAITALVQFGAMIMAAYYMEQTISNRADELAAIPIDEEVAELEEGEVALNNSYTRVTQWPVVPLAMKLVLYVTFAVIVAACYMVMFFGDLCWAEYSLTHTIDEHLDGKWYNLVLPLGWVAIVLFCVSCILLYVFIVWAGVKAKKDLASRPPEEDAEEKNEGVLALPPSSRHNGEMAVAAGTAAGVALVDGAAALAVGGL